MRKKPKPTVEQPMIRGIEDCANCVRKHLCAAMVVHTDEVFLGYPEHIDRVVGNLNEAARESLPHFVGLAEALREVRLRVMDDGMDVPPYQSLLDWLRACVAASDCGAACPAAPEEVQAWLGQD